MLKYYEYTQTVSSICRQGHQYHISLCDYFEKILKNCWSLEEESTDADLATDEEEDLADDEDNTDITAGTTDEDGNYSAYAILNGKVDANVTALASDIKTDDFSSSADSFPAHLSAAFSKN